MLTRNQIIAVEQADRRHVRAKKIYIDMINNLHAGMVLSEIVYWHTPSKTGKRRLRQIPGQVDEWLACRRQSWWDRCRLTAREFDRALEKLIKAKLVVRDYFDYKGQKTLHVRINWPIFIPLYNKVLETNGTKPTKRRIVLPGLPALWDAILSILAVLDTIEQVEGVSPIGNTPSPHGDTYSPIGNTESPRGDTYTVIETTIDIETVKPQESFAAPAAPDSEIQNPEPAIPGAFEETIEMLDIPNAPKPPERVLVPVDDDWDKPPDLYDCTSQDIAAVLHAYYTWCPKDKLPTKRGKVVAFNKGVVNMPANREYAENQIRRGIVPSDYIEFLSNLGHFLKIESADRYARMANNLNVEEPLAFKWLKNLEKQRELPFCYLAPIVEEWVAAGRDWYTDECPRVLHRHPDVTPRITLGQDERENPDLVVDVPPPYISPHAAAALIDDDDYEDDSESDDMDNWTPDDWAKAGMPL